MSCEISPPGEYFTRRAIDFPPTASSTTSKIRRPETLWRHKTCRGRCLGGGSIPRNRLCRPLSLTSHICKILESAVRKFQWKYLESDLFIRNSQHGFTKRRYYLTKLLEFLDKVSDCVDSQGVHVGGGIACICTPAWIDQMESLAL